MAACSDGVGDFGIGFRGEGGILVDAFGGVLAYGGRVCGLDYRGEGFVGLGGGGCIMPSTLISRFLHGR